VESGDERESESGGCEEGHGLSREDGVEDAGEGAGEEELDDADGAVGGGASDRAERDGRGEAGEEEEEDCGDRFGDVAGSEGGGVVGHIVRRAPFNVLGESLAEVNLVEEREGAGPGVVRGQGKCNRGGGGRVVEL